MSDKPLTFSERRRLLAQERGEKLPVDEKPNPVQHDTDVIPDVLPVRSEEDIEMDRIIEGIGVLEAYQKWIFGGGKTVDTHTLGRREGVKVSCPKPEHPDKNPSAWLNLDKNTWFCGGCQEGGDSYDLAAIYHGYPIPGYKEGKTFHELRRQMAEDFGWRLKKVIGGTIAYKEEPEDVEPAPRVDNSGKQDNTAQTELEEPEPTSSNVSVMFADETAEDTEAEVIKYPSIDWRDLAVPDTFLYNYCEATSHDDSPEEYHFWHGLLALAHAVGRNVYLDDTKPVYGNMLVCLLGGTGYGKSRSRGWLDAVLESVLPFQDNGLDTSGCKLVPVPASGEVLIKTFRHEANDPSLPKNMGVLTPVNGIVDFDEFASLLARANRQGNTLKTTIMGLADGRHLVSSASLTHGDLTALDPFCSITASTQPKAVRTLLSRNDAGSGFLNRWVFVGGKRKKREVIGGSHSAIRVDLTDAITSLKRVKAWGAKERPVRMTEDGLSELQRFYEKRIFPMQESDETDLLKRLDLLFKRLVLLFCINEKLAEADSRIVKLAEKLFDYVVDCYGILNNEIGVTLLNEISTEILRHVQRHQDRTGRGASANDLARYMKRKTYPIDQIKRSLETMVALDWLELDKPKSSVGRPTVRYKVVS